MNNTCMRQRSCQVFSFCYGFFVTDWNHINMKGYNMCLRSSLLRMP
jgi:hypothetical protein